MLGLGTRLGLTSKIKAAYAIRKRMRKTVSGAIMFYNVGTKLIKFI